jgi:hypothetical protein
VAFNLDKHQQLGKKILRQVLLATIQEFVNYKEKEEVKKQINQVKVDSSFRWIGRFSPKLVNFLPLQI